MSRTKFILTAIVAVSLALLIAAALAACVSIPVGSHHGKPVAEIELTR
jgi:curli biogenesis system outer membrane secretion channel CsgG